MSQSRSHYPAFKTAPFNWSPRRIDSYMLHAVFLGSDMETGEQDIITISPQYYGVVDGSGGFVLHASDYQDGIYGDGKDHKFDMEHVDFPCVLRKTYRYKTDFGEDPTKILVMHILDDSDSPENIRALVPLENKNLKAIETARFLDMIPSVPAS